jgi:hypothetical protein
MPPKAKTTEAWQTEILERLRESEETIRTLKITQEALLQRANESEELIMEYKKTQELLITKINEIETKLVIKTAKRELEVKDLRDTMEFVKTMSVYDYDHEHSDKILSV